MCRTGIGYLGGQRIGERGKLVADGCPAVLLLEPFAGIALAGRGPQDSVDLRCPGPHETLKFGRHRLPLPDHVEIEPASGPLRESGKQIGCDLRSECGERHLAHDTLRGAIGDADRDEPPEPEVVGWRWRLILHALHEVLKILLAAETHAIGLTVPGIQIARQVELAEPARLGRLRAECLRVGRPVGRLLLGREIGAARPLVEPAPLASLKPAVVRKFLDSLMKRIVR